MAQKPILYVTLHFQDCHGAASPQYQPLRNHCSYVSTKALSHAIVMSVQELFSGEMSFNSPFLRQKCC